MRFSDILNEATQNKFVQQNYKLAKDIGDRIGVDPKIILGHWALETGWGKHTIPGTNNLGNIKDFSGKGVRAYDKIEKSNDAYRSYKKPEDFASDYANLLSKRYPGVVGSGSDVNNFIKGLQGGKLKYATGGRFEKSLAQMPSSVERYLSTPASQPSLPTAPAPKVNLPPVTRSEPATFSYKGSAGSQAIQKLNPDVIKDVNKIYTGQVLNLPGGKNYTIKAGDTLDQIAKRELSTPEVNEAESKTKNSAAIFKKLKAAGYKKLGSGADSTVWTKDDASVIKILMPEDSNSLAEKTFLKFYDFVQSNSNLANLPKFLESTQTMNINGKDYTFVVMERLGHIKRGSFDEAMVWILSDFAVKKMPWEDVLKELSNPEIWKYWDGPPPVDKILKTIDNLDEKMSMRYGILYQLMTLLYHTGRINKLGWDLHTENVMQRADGTLVIIDPWFALSEY